MLIWKRLESHFHIWEWWNRCRYLRFIRIIYWYRWIRIGCRWSWHIPIRSETNVHFVLNHLLIRYEMECLCIEEYYTPNLETSKSIKIGDPTVNDYHVSSIWMMKESYHIISDDLWLLWFYTNKVCDDMMNSMKSVRNQRISDPIEEKVCNHRINDMEWTMYWIWMEWIWIHQEMKTTTWNHEYNTQISRS